MNIRRKVTSEEEMKSCSVQDAIGLYGIVDDYGVDQVYRTDEQNQPNMNFLALRCRYNGHRNARIFCCIIGKQYIPSFNMDKTELYYELKRRAISFSD